VLGEVRWRGRRVEERGEEDAPGGEWSWREKEVQGRSRVWLGSIE